jgi:hypothetical protein
LFQIHENHQKNIFFLFLIDPILANDDYFNNLSAIELGPDIKKLVSIGCNAGQPLSQSTQTSIFECTENVRISAWHATPKHQDTRTMLHLLTSRGGVVHKMDVHDRSGRKESEKQKGKIK